MTQKKILYSNTSKDIYIEKKKNTVYYDYNDNIELDNNKIISIKGAKFKLAAINNFILSYLNSYNISTNYIGIIKRNIITFEQFELLPICIKIINTVNKKIGKIFNLVEGTNIPFPIYEIYLLNDKNNLVTESHLISLNICSVNDIKTVTRIASKVNAVLKVFFERRNALLNEMICYFGKYEDKYFVIDDFTPLSVRITPIYQNILNFNTLKITKDTHMEEYIEFFYKLITTNK